jgi:hypothetical protein
MPGSRIGKIAHHLTGYPAHDKNAGSGYDGPKFFYPESILLVVMKRYSPFLLISAGLLILLSGFTYWRFNTLITNSSPAPLPEEIADLPLVRESTGRQASKEIASMHRKEFPLSSAAVGVYGKENQVTVWVSGSPFELMAGRMLEDMGKRIAQGNSPFMPLGERTKSSRRVFELKGMGQKHFYFQSGKLVIWVAVRPDLAEPVLEQILQFYP